MSCLKMSVTPTPPTPPVSVPPQAAAAAAAAAAEKQSAAEVSTSPIDAAPAAEEPLCVRKITGGEVEVPLAAGMTAADLKQELQRRDEGPVAQLRLLYAGKELVDGLTLQLQKVRPGVTIHLVLKHVPIKLLPPSQGSSSLSLGAYGGGKRCRSARRASCPHCRARCASSSASCRRAATRSR